MRRVELDTLAAVHGRHAIAGYCPDCRRHAWLDICKIAASAGWSLSIERLKRRLSCRNCGSRQIEIRLVYRPVDPPAGYSPQRTSAATRSFSALPEEQRPDT